MKLFPRIATDTEMVETDAALSEEVMKMTTEDLIARTRLLDNDCKIMRSGLITVLASEVVNILFRTCSNYSRDNDNEGKDKRKQRQSKSK